MMLPIGCVGLVVKPLAGDLFRAEWVDATLREAVCADVTLDELAQWECEGAPPTSLIERRWTVAELDADIARLRARQAELSKRRDQLVDEFPQLKSYTRQEA
jgi:hypothetical protein